MVFVHVFVHGTKEIINILVISLIQSELHSLIITRFLCCCCTDIASCPFCATRQA